MNAPARAGLQGLNDLYKLVAYGQNNELLVRRHEREARTLLERGSSPALAWLALAAAFFLQARRSESIEALNNAVALASSDEAVLGNATALFDIGRLIDTSHRLLRAVDNVEGKKSAVFCLKKALQLEDMLAMAEKYELRLSDSTIHWTKALLALADEHHMDPGKRVKLVETAAEAVRLQGCMVRQTALTQVHDQLRYELFVDESAQRCAELSFAIAEALCENFDDPAPELVTFACRPLSSYQFGGDFVQVSR